MINKPCDIAVTKIETRPKTRLDLGIGHLFKNQ